MCPQEGVPGHKSRIQSPYQIWLARKVERAVERALHHEGQQLLEEYDVSRNWVLPQICEERRLVATKIHSLLLQWRPDFSAEWSLKLRRALPVLEILFAHLAPSKEDFSNPLLIEPRLKGVLSLLDSHCHKESSPCPIQSSTHHTFASYLYCFHHPSHHFCSAEQIEAAEKACVCKSSCLHVDEERSHHIGQEVCFCRSCLLDADKERRNVKGHEAHVSPNLNEKRSSDIKTHTAISCLRESCLYWQESLDMKSQNAFVFRSCLRIADRELDEGTLDDSLEWSTGNLPPRGTVASLMASELRSSRKEEANQALWNALASNEVALLKDNLHKHGEFASKWMVNKIVTMLKGSKKRKQHQRGKKVCAEAQLLHTAAEQKNCGSEPPTLKMRRSLSKGFFGLFSCHTTASEECGLPAYQKPLPADLEALELNHPSCLVCTHSKHVGDRAEKDAATQAEVPISCSSSMLSFNASSAVLSSSDDDNDNDSCHSIHHTKFLHCKPIIETPASLVAISTRIKSSEELRSRDSDNMHSRMLSGNALACHDNVEIGIAVSSGYGCADGQIHLDQSSSEDGNGAVISNQIARSDRDSSDIIKSADKDSGLIDNYDLKGASTVSCSCHGDSESHGTSTSVISHDDDHDDGIRSFACSFIRNDLSRGKEKEVAACCFTEAYTGFKGRREDPPNCSLSLEEACASPCKASLDSKVDGPGNMMKPRSTNTILSHMNSDIDRKLAEAKMQKTSSLHKDEKSTATSSNVLQGTEDKSRVTEASAAEFGATQSRDEERQGASSRSQRVRVPLSSLLAKREDWSSTRSSRARGGPCPWDTWEEPNEALDPLCCVCMMGLKGAAFTPCGHTFCRKCSRELWQGRGTCPLCNKLITGILDIF